MRDIAFVLAMLSLIPILLRYAEVGVLIWVWTALLAPNELFYGFVAGVPIGKAISITSLGVLFMAKNRKFWRVDAMFVTLFCLLAVGTVSAYTAMVDTGLNWELYSKLSKIVVLAFVISVLMGTRVRMHAMICAICLGLGFHGVVEGLMFMGTAGGHKILGIASVGDNNSFALAELMILPLMLYLYRQSVVPAVRWVMVLGFVLVLVSVVGTYSRGGFVGMAVLGLSVVGTSRRKLPAAVLVLFIVLAGYFLAPESWFQRVDSISDASDDGSFMGRVIAWKLSTLVALHHPLFGGGFHAIQNLQVWRAFQDQFSMFDFIRTSLPDETPHAAHSIYFELLGDLGFTGLGLFLLLLGLAFWNTVVVRRLTKDRPDLAWARDMTTMLAVSLAIFCVAGAALSQGYFEMLYIQLAMMSRLRSMMEVELGLRSAQTGKKLRLTAPTALVGQDVRPGPGTLAPAPVGLIRIAR